jgi:hypothetical protein
MVYSACNAAATYRCALAQSAGLGEAINMLSQRVTIAMAFFGFAAGCGGPGEDATVPVAQPAGVTSADIGEHVLHFNALSTDRLPPEIASAYNIVRSKNRAMITVSLIEEESGTPTAGDVSLKTVNLTGQLKNVTMRRIDEPGDPPAIYYVGTTPVANHETLIFDIMVTPEGKTRPSEVRFKQQFYTD